MFSKVGNMKRYQKNSFEDIRLIVILGSERKIKIVNKIQNSEKNKKENEEKIVGYIGGEKH